MIPNGETCLKLVLAPEAEGETSVNLGLKNSGSEVCQLWLQPWGQGQGLCLLLSAVAETMDFFPAASRTRGSSLLNLLIIASRIPRKN